MNRSRRTMFAQNSSTIRLVIFAISLFGLYAAAPTSGFLSPRIFAQSAPTVQRDQTRNDLPGSPDSALQSEDVQGKSDNALKETDDSNAETTDAKRRPIDKATDARRIMDLLKPDGVFLLDENDNRIYVPTDSYESFQDYLKSKTSTGKEDVGQYLIEKNDVSINVDGDFARIEMELTARVFGRQNGTYRVPVSLSKLAITEVPVVSPDDSGFVKVIDSTTSRDLDAETRAAPAPAKGALSYEWVIRYIPDTPLYKLKIVGVVPIADAQGRRAIELELPQSTTRIRLTLPRNDVGVELNSGFGEVLSQVNSEDKTVATITTSGGRFGLTWASQDSVAAPELITVTSSTQYVFDAIQNRWSGSAAFQFASAKSLAGQEFEITLPPNCQVNEQTLARIESESSQGYQLSVLDNEATNSRSLQLRFGPSINYRQSTIEISFAVDSTNLARQDFGQIAISNLQEHYGTVSFSIPESRQFRWTESSGLRIKRVSANTEGVTGTVFEFEFDKQQFQLNSRLLSTAQEQKTIRPSYVLTVDKNRHATLRGVVEFPSSFQLVTNLRINPHGWEVKNLSLFPSNETDINFLVDEQGIIIPDTYSLLLANGAISPLNSNGVNRAISINCELPDANFSNSNAEEQQSMLEFQLPTFSYESSLESVYESQGDGFLALSFDNTILAKPDVAKIIGLEPDNSEVAILNSMLQSSSSVSDNQYQFSSSDPPPSWVGSLEKRQVEALAVSNTDIQITESSCRTVQNWSMTIRHGKIDEFLFLVPSVLITNDRSLLPFTFSISMNGEPTPWRVATEKPAHLPEDASTSVIRLVREPQEGRVEIESQIIVSLPELPPNGGVADELFGTELFYIQPLVDVTNVENGVTVVAENSIDCEIPTDFLVEKTIDESSTKFGLALPSDQCKIPIAIGTNKKSLNPSARLDRYWIETIVGRNERRDRIIGVVRSDVNTLPIEFADGQELEQIQILVNGVEILPPIKPVQSRYEIPISGTDNVEQAGQQKHIVEIFVWSTVPTGYVNSLHPIVPAFDGVSPKCSFAWELNLPSRNLIVSHDEELVGQFKWKWSLAGLTRTDTGDNNSLSRWLGVATQPSEGRPRNRYLFYGVASTETAEVAIVPSFLIWSPIAFLVLVLAAVWCFLPKARNPFWLLLIAGVAFLISFFSVDLAILVVQSATFALVILMLVGLVHLAIEHRTKSRSIFENVSSSNRQGAGSTMESLADGYATTGSTATERRL